jgi:hypothetical protein
MKNILETLSFKVSGKGMYEITSDVSNWVTQHILEKVI